MTDTGENGFEALWQQALNEPEVKSAVVKNRITVDLSLESVLDRYTDFARKAVAEHRISESKFLDLKKQTKRFKQALGEIEDGSLLDELKDLTKILNPFD